MFVFHARWQSFNQQHCMFHEPSQVWFLNNQPGRIPKPSQPKITKEQVIVCLSSNFCVYACRAFVERSVILVFLVIGSSPIKCQCVFTLEQWMKYPVVRDSELSWVQLPSNRVLMWLFYFVKFMFLKYFMTFENLVSALLCTIW